jgi:hypothetical protein
MKRKNPHAVALGRLGGKVGGRVKSKAKTRAARENGKLGGRPLKPGPEKDIERQLLEAKTGAILSDEEIERIVRDPGSKTAGLSEDKIQEVLRVLRGAPRTENNLRSWIELGNYDTQIAVRRRRRADAWN